MSKSERGIINLILLFLTKETKLEIYFLPFFTGGVLCLLIFLIPNVALFRCNHKYEC